jgi:hypothetical protein
MQTTNLRRSMTKTARKPRTDSIPEVTRIMQGAAREIAPPAHVSLQDMDWPFWHSVVAEFARADWTEHQLELAAMLSRTMADLEENQRLLRHEGIICHREVLNDDGSVRKIITWDNARARAVQTMMGQVLSLRRSLALTGRAKAGSSGDAAKQRDANKKTESLASGEDDLLA